MRLKTVLALAVLLITQHSLMTAQAADPVAALTGEWKLNVEASTNPNGPDSAPGITRPPSVGMELMFRDYQIENGALWEAPRTVGNDELRRVNTHLTMFRQAPALLDIHATAKDVVLTYDTDPANGMTYKYMTNGKKSVMDTPDGAIDVKVNWNGTALRREIETNEALKVVEDYTPNADGKQLIVTVDVSSVKFRMQKAEIKRVYDRVK